MTGFVQEHLRPLAGAAGLHLALVGLLALAAAALLALARTIRSTWALR